MKVERRLPFRTTTHRTVGVDISVAADGGADPAFRRQLEALLREHVVERLTDEGVGSLARFCGTRSTIEVRVSKDGITRAELAAGRWVIHAADGPDREPAAVVANVARELARFVAIETGHPVAECLRTMGLDADAIDELPHRAEVARLNAAIKGTGEQEPDRIIDPAVHNFNAAAARRR